MILWEGGRTTRKQETPYLSYVAGCRGLRSRIQRTSSAGLLCSEAWPAYIPTYAKPHKTFQQVRRPQWKGLIFPGLTASRMTFFFGSTISFPERISKHCQDSAKTQEDMPGLTPSKGVGQSPFAATWPQGCGRAGQVWQQGARCQRSTPQQCQAPTAVWGCS